MKQIYKKTIRWIKGQLSEDNLELGLKIAAGIILSIALAEWLGVDFAPSTGVVALLSIQSTKRQTLKTALRRLVSFGYTLLFCYGAHAWFGSYNSGEFILSVLAIVLLSVFLGWGDTLSVNIVIVVHMFMMREPFTPHLLLNETIRVIIGISVAVAINWYTPNRERIYMKRFERLENTLYEILMIYAGFLRGRNTLDTAQEMLDKLAEEIYDGKADALTFYNNTLHTHARYYLEYMTMREQEIPALRSIYKELCPLHQVPKSSFALADYIDQMADTIAAKRPVEVWEEHFAKTYRQMNTIALPKDREEFQGQAALFGVLSDLYEIVHIKRTFIEGLTEQQKARYWT